MFETRPTILLAVTSSISWTFYRGIPRHLRQQRLEPVLLSSPGPDLIAIGVDEDASCISVPMKRGIAPFADIVSLWKLYRALRAVRPDIVDAATPKAGFLVNVAARLAGVEHTVYSMLGLRLETTSGLKRLLLQAAEWVACACADRVICMSPSLRERVIALKLTSREKCVVLGKGSFGLQLDRFAPRDLHSQEIQRTAKELDIPLGVPVVGFVGRIVNDKGIRELFTAFTRLRAAIPDLRLLLVGDFEDGDPLDYQLRCAIRSTPEVICTGFVPDPAPYYKLMDVLALPSHREGFGQVSIEAQACAIPVVTTNATGAIDSVADGMTGLVVPVGDSEALAAAIGKLIGDPELRERLGRAGWLRAQQDFRRESLWDARMKLYRDLLASKQSKHASAKLSAKRIFDLLAAVLSFLFLSPLFLFVGLLVRVMIGHPIFFLQKRPGLHGASFTLLKFRTMTNARNANGELLPDAQRLTAFGRFLRSTSLDELPELFNVILGDMSLVGPRPLLTQYLDRYTPEQRRRHLVKPGITGWAQINGRNALDWEHKLALDVWYVDHRTLALDIGILARTLWQVLRREGITQEGHATMPEFLGIADRQRENA